MQVKISPVFQMFEKQYNEARELFLVLGKQIKSRKAIELSMKMDFLEVYTDLLGKIHFEEKGLNFDFFSPFKKLQKNLRKIHHFKLVEKNLKTKELKAGVEFDSYKSFLADHKKNLYTETFDLIISSTLKPWDDFIHKSQESSRGVKALMISTAINQIVREELEFFQLDHKGHMDSKAFKDTFEGLRTIIMLENLLVHLGFNPIFIAGIHQEIEGLKNNLKPWYSNHLSLQSLTHFLGQREGASKKYLDWVKELKEEKKSLSSLAEKQAKALFDKILV